MFLGAGFNVPKFGTYKNEKRGEVMKEKLARAREWVKQHKKRSAGIAAAIIAVLVAASVGAAGLYSASPENKKSETEAEQKTVRDNAKTKNTNSNKEKKTAVSDQEKPEDDVKADNGSAADDQKKTDAGKQTADNNAAVAASNAGASNQAASSGSGGAGSGNNSAQSHSHSYTIPVYGTEKKWVVDQAAWTETVNEPIYEMQERSICNTCGADITGNTTAHGKETRHDGYHSEWIQVQTGTNTYTIEHPEQGHWESYSVVTGYQCSCGYAQ